MIEEILPSLYVIRVPLPQSPLKAINSYVIKNQRKSLIVDTGQNREECKSALSSGLKELDVDLNQADFFITHLHADHLGLVSSLAKQTSTIYFNEPDANVVQSPSTWKKNDSFALTHGFPEDELIQAIENHPGQRYSSRTHVDFNILKEGDTVNINNYSFQCIETPGHTRGHMCLYEPGKKIFISGDHILNDITPNISLWSEDKNALDDYLNSLDKVYNYEVELVLPGHRGAFQNFKGRIKELKHHHRARANEVLAILEAGSRNTFQVASQMTWDVDYKSWEQFPPHQKWFAFGEAFAHLKYLEERGEIRRDIQDRKVVFSLK